MTITSTGYERAINYAKFGELLAHAGAQYSVFGRDAFAAAVGSGAREVLVQPGRAAGQGVIDDSDETIALAGAAVAAGDRWDCIALRRNWITAESTLVLIPGGSTETIPTRLTDPGDEDDQPLWLVRFSAGQAAAQDFVDLRVWHGDGGCAAKDMLVRDYLTRIGTRVWIQGITWVLGFNSSGDPAWVTDSVLFGSTPPSGTAYAPFIKVP